MDMRRCFLMNVVKELIIIRELLGITQEELAKKIGVSFETINRWEKDKNEIEIKNINKLYNFAFENKIYINSIYELLFLEEFQKDTNKVLFHGSKSNEINFPLDLSYSKSNNDFGVGFYLGENYKQAATYIANGNSVSVYAFNLNLNGLRIKKFNVDK